MTTTKEQRDTLLGRKLTAALAAVPSGACPAPETIAALVEGRVAGDERDLLLGHLAACRDCRELFTLTAELSRPEKTHSGRRWTVMAGAVAAVLVAAVSLILVARSPEQQVAQVAPSPVQHTGRPAPPVASAKAEDPLAAAARLLASALGSDVIPAPLAADRVLGFATTPDRKRESLDLGRNLFILELAIARNDRAAVARTLGEIGRLAERQGVAEPVRTELRRLAGSEPGAGLRDRIEALMAPALSREEGSYLTLGSWGEGALLAAAAGQREYFASAYFRQEATRLTTSELPKPLASSVRRLTALAGGPALNAKEFHEIERLAEELLEE